MCNISYKSLICPFCPVCHWQSAVSRVSSLRLTELGLDGKASQFWDQHRVLHLRSLPRQPATIPLQTACRLLLLVPEYLKYSCRKLMLIFTQNIHLCFFTLCVSQSHPRGRSALQYISGDCSLCRDSASCSEPGLPSSEQNPASTGDSGGHGAHLPETHHCQ